MSNKNSNATINGEKFCYTIKEVGDMLGLTRYAVYAILQRGDLHSIKLGSGRNCAVRILKSDFDSYIKHLKEAK